MTSINSDFMSQLALRSLGNSSNMMTQAMERLSTGKRVNSAADDAAGLGIATKLKAQVNSLNAATRNAGDALALIGTIDGALEESSEILLRMRELAVQSASDSNTGTDRTFIQDEINAMNNELNRISSATEFNSVKLLDGTYTNKAIQIGTGANQVFRIGVSSTDTNTLGAYEKHTLVEHMAETTSHEAAHAGLKDQFSADADYVVKGAFGEKTASVQGGATARDVARAFNLVAGTTGVNASVITRAKITDLTAVSYTFTLSGKNFEDADKATVNVAIANASDVTALKDAINAVSGKTGITANLTDDLAGVNLVQSEGYNIVIGDVTGGNLKVVSQYKNDKGEIKDTAGPKTLTSGAKDSTAIVGQVSLSSHKAFTVTPGDTGNIFSAGSTAENSKLMTMGTVDVSSQNGANNAISIIDGAIAMISETRSKMGASENRLTSTVDNLSNVAVNTSRSLTSVEDANFASETSALTKSQILQQAATSMLAQANQAKQTMLVLLQG